MPTPTIKTKVAIEGEKEYKQAISEINSGLKVLNSEMKLTSEQFADNADSVEALTAKNDVLERQILTQRDKIETLKSALQNSAEAYGEADKRTAQWQVSLNDAEAVLIKMERELKENQEALQKAGQTAENAGNAFDGMTDSIDESGDAAKDNKTIMDKLRDAFGGTEDKGRSLGEMAEDLAGKLGINLPDGAKKALDAIGNVDASTAVLAGTAAAAAAAIVKIEQALIDLTTDQAAAATEIYNISQIINMTVQETQEWDYVLKTVGSSISQAQGDLSAFQEKIMEAAGGTGEAAEMFNKLGVSVVDQNGSLRTTSEVLNDTIVALQLMADETERNAISSTLLGGTGEALIPIYEQNAQYVQHLIDKKRELGVMTGDEIETLRDVSEALLDYEERTESAKNKIAVEFAPALAAFYEGAGEGLLQLGESAADSGLVNFFGSILELVTSLAPALDLLGAGLEILGPIFNSAAVTVALFADGLSVVLNLIAALGNLLTLDFKGAGQNWDNVMSIFSAGGNSATARAWSNAYGPEKTQSKTPFNASGNDNFDGGFTWVGENGPELAYLPQGTRIFNNQESREMGGDTFYVTIDAKNVKEFNDIVEMARAKRRKDRMEGQNGYNQIDI